MDDLPSYAALTAPSVNFTGTELARLAAEMAMDIQTVENILDRFGLTAAQFDFIKENADFKRFYEQAVIEWNSAISAPQRIKLQAAAALEANLPKLSARMARDTEALPAVVETGKLLAKLAGIGEQIASGIPGERFSIVINLGGDEQIKIEKDIKDATDLDLLTVKSPAE